MDDYGGLLRFQQVRARERALDIVPMRGWRRGDVFEETGPWIRVPHLPTVETAYGYKGRLIAGTSLGGEGARLSPSSGSALRSRRTRWRSRRDMGCGGRLSQNVSRISEMGRKGVWRGGDQISTARRLSVRRVSRCCRAKRLPRRDRLAARPYELSTIGRDRL